MPDPSQQDAMLTAPEVARLFAVAAGAPQMWARAGKIPAIRTPGGRWLFPERQVRAMLVAEPVDLDSVLARAHEVADKVTFDWAEPDDDSTAVTVLVYGAAGGFGMAGGPTAAEALSTALAALKTAEAALKARRAGGAE